MTRTFHIGAVSCILAAAVGIALLSACESADEAAKAASSAPVASKPAVIPIATATAIARQVSTVVRATGTFVADESSDMTPQVSGQVVATPVNVGDRVTAGQVIVRLDDRDARLRLDQVQASLQQADAQAQHARAEATRYRKLEQRGLISPSEIERLTTQVATAEAAVAQVRAQVASAQKALDDTAVRAPFSGHVSARPVAAGEYVTPASKVSTIVRIQPIKLELQVPQSDAVKLGTGMPVHAELAAYPGVTFKGSVSALNVAIDPSSRAMTVEARFPNADARLTPGMFGSAQVHLPATEPAVFVPAAAVIKIAGGTSSAVYVIEENKAQVRVVQLGEERDGMIRVHAGLRGGESLATSNLDRLYAGALVRTAAGASNAGGAAGGGR